MSTLEMFVHESNLIEGIRRAPLPLEIEAHRLFLDHLPGDINIGHLCSFVRMIQPDAVLRNRQGLNVRVGNHVPPLGSPEIAEQLKTLLVEAQNFPRRRVYSTHVRYEKLHPFTDGNGRSGRALWLWMMGGPEQVPLGFLHHWYYQSLSRSY